MGLFFRNPSWPSSNRARIIFVAPRENAPVANRGWFRAFFARRVVFDRDENRLPGDIFGLSYARLARWRNVPEMSRKCRQRGAFSCSISSSDVLPLELGIRRLKSLMNKRLSRWNALKRIMRITKKKSWKVSDNRAGNIGVTSLKKIKIRNVSTFRIS